MAGGNRGTQFHGVKCKQNKLKMFLISTKKFLERGFFFG